ncbi:Hypothetical predicted protein [Podarcis lilfordi]|uniref:Uncharacterized protein n=1 Tax=Podarcis lilfordi TaxID=74358 RepID=A0AA35JXK6_9SAUR|nr:Hypothetical predicted protein [Podarcis lilfordi]
MHFVERCKPAEDEAINRFWLQRGICNVRNSEQYTSEHETRKVPTYLTILNVL